MDLWQSCRYVDERAAPSDSWDAFGILLQGSTAEPSLADARTVVDGAGVRRWLVVLASTAVLGSLTWWLCRPDGAVGVQSVLGGQSGVFLQVRLMEVLGLGATHGAEVGRWASVAYGGAAVAIGSVVALVTVIEYSHFLGRGATGGVHPAQDPTTSGAGVDGDPTRPYAARSGRAGGIRNAQPGSGRVGAPPAA